MNKDVSVAGSRELVGALGLPLGCRYTWENFLDGITARFTFPNGWELSAIRHSASYGGNKGLWEVALFKPDGEFAGMHWITEGLSADVEGWLTGNDVVDRLHLVAKLPPVEQITKE